LQNEDHDRIRGLASLIGNTPLLAVKCRYQGQDRTIYAKAENLNMSGFLGSIRKAEELAGRLENAFLPRQFSIRDNSDAHFQTTGPEIWWQPRFRSLTPDALVAGVGTGGTIMGTGSFLKEKNPAIQLHPLEPTSSPTLTTGHKVGKHRIQGISDEFIPPILDLDILDECMRVSTADIMEEITLPHCPRRGKSLNSESCR
jgi:cysteine synthase